MNVAMMSLATLLAENLYYAFLGAVILYVFLRVRYPRSTKKRNSIFILMVAFFLAFTGGTLVQTEKIPAFWLLPLLLLIIGGTTFLLIRFWPFRMTCARCGEKLDGKTLFTDDRNLCSDCLTAEEQSEEEEDTPLPEKADLDSAEHETGSTDEE